MNTPECRQAVEKLLASIEPENLQTSNLKSVIEHVTACPGCQQRMGHLVLALGTTNADSLTCQACEDDLPEYLEADLAGQASGARWQMLRHHLATCPHCAAEYALLVDLATLAGSEQAVEPAAYPEPDLSFLNRGQSETAIAAKKSWRLNALGHLIIEISGEIVRAFQSPAYAAPRLKSGQRTLYRYSLAEGIEDLEVTVEAEATRNNPAVCTIVVEINIPSRGGWPNLGGAKVILKRGEEELETLWTDAYGTVEFTGIAADDLIHLSFEIIPEESKA